MGKNKREAIVSRVMEIYNEKNGRNYAGEVRNVVREEFGVDMNLNQIRNIVYHNKGKIEEVKEEEIKEEGKVTVKEGYEQKQPTFEKSGDVYLIYDRKGEQRTEISVGKLRRLKEFYCDVDKPMTINQVSRNLNIPRRDFMLIKNAFGITKDDVPFIDEDLEQADIEDLVEETLEKKKERFFVSLGEKEIEKMKKELDNYRKHGYVLSQVVERLKEEGVMEKFELEPITTPEVEGENEAQLNLADWHTGLKVDNYWNKYSVVELQKRAKKMTQETIKRCKMHNVKTLHVMNLGDLLHGIIHVSTRVVSEVDLIEQLRVTWTLIAQILRELAKEIPEVKFYSTYGNHSRVTEEKNAALDRENLELLIPDFLEASLVNIPNVEIMKNDVEDQIIMAEIKGKTIFAVHGDRDRFKSVAENLTLMLEQKPYKIFLAHTHHLQADERHKIDIIVSRSMCGVDDYAKDIRATSRAGQSLYIYEDNNLFVTYDITFN